MRNDDDPVEGQYEKPRITDHGNLTDLTAGLSGGHLLDHTMPTQHDNPDEKPHSTPR